MPLSMNLSQQLFFEKIYMILDFLGGGNLVVNEQKVNVKNSY